MSTLRNQSGWRSDVRFKKRRRLLKRRAAQKKAIRIKMPDVTIEGGGNFKIDYYMDYITEIFVLEAMIASAWSMTDAARMLGISQQQVQRRMVKYGVAADTAKERLEVLRGCRFEPFLTMTAEPRGAVAIA